MLFVGVVSWLKMAEPEEEEVGDSWEDIEEEVREGGSPINEYNVGPYSETNYKTTRAPIQRGAVRFCIGNYLK